MIYWIGFAICFGLIVYSFVTDEADRRMYFEPKMFIPLNIIFLLMSLVWPLWAILIALSILTEVKI